MKWPTSGK